jgi:alkaline phosphatase D
MDKDRKANPHCLLANSQHRGYGLVDVAPGEAIVSLRSVDALAPEQPPVTTLARFRVRRGEGGVERVG